MVPTTTGPVANNTNPSARVRAAIDATAVAPGLADHWRGLVVSRTSGPAASGSVVDGALSPEVTVALLRAATWTPLTGPAAQTVRAPAVAFWTPDVRGRVGVVPTDSLPADARLVLRDPHDTGCVSAEYEGDIGVLGAPAEGTCILLGPDGDVEIVWTFHPGPPVGPSTVPACALAILERPWVTPAEALSLGLMTAKIVQSRPTTA